jgi:hypothetical protein
MYLGVIFVFAMILVFLSPAIWVAWWMLADLGARAGGQDVRPAQAPARFRPAA